jgi:hypothetical protein
LPELEAVRSKYADRVGFLALSIDHNREKVRAMATRLTLRMEVATADGELLGPLGVNQVPATLFVDAEGTIVASVNGERPRAFFERRIEELLRPPH